MSSTIRPYRVVVYHPRNGHTPDIVTWTSIEQFLHQASTRSWDEATEWMRRIKPNITAITPHVSATIIEPDTYDHTLVVANEYSRVDPRIFAVALERVVSFTRQMPQVGHHVNDGRPAYWDGGLVESITDSLLSMALQLGLADVDHGKLVDAYQASVCHRQLLQHVLTTAANERAPWRSRPMVNIRRVSFQHDRGFLYFSHEPIVNKPAQPETLHG